MEIQHTHLLLKIASALLSSGVADTHDIYTNAPHPFLPNANPINPVDRLEFNVDKIAYWKNSESREV